MRAATRTDASHCDCHRKALSLIIIFSTAAAVVALPIECEWKPICLNGPAMPVTVCILFAKHTISRVEHNSEPHISITYEL